MRRRRTELAYVCLLPAVPKAWRATMALTQLPAVEPSCGGFCGELPRSALFATVFLNIIIGRAENECSI
jgi:hypothetical protein